MRKIRKRKMAVRGSLQKKMIWIYIVMAIIPIVLITVIANVIYTKSFLEQSSALVERNARQHEIIVQERMKQYENVLYELVADSDIIKTADKINTGTLTSWLVDREAMERKFSSVAYTYNMIRGISFLADNGYYASYSRYYGSSGDIIWSNEKDREQIHDTFADADELTDISMVELNKRGEKPDYAVLIGYPVRDLRTKESSGVLVLALDSAILQFEGISSEENGITTVITDQDDRILTGTGDAYINRTFRSYLEAEHSNIRVSVIEHEIGNTDWTIKNIIDIARQRADIYRFDRIVFLVMLGIMLLFFWIVYHFSKGYLEDVNRIVTAITGFGETPEVIRVELKQKDELYIIAKQFNAMTKRVNDLMETLRQRNEEIRIAAEHQKHAEIVALEAQINPHFLYNTLDSINWRAISHGEEEISDMLGMLGSLLRYSVSNIEQVVMLEAEIEWLKKYVFLQRDRFHDSFDCTYDITEEAREFPIYKMLLQPIIENIILHAFEEVRANGLIQVKAYVLDGKLNLHVRDNGCGMEEEMLGMIRKMIEGSGALSSDSIGISNVIHRLKIYYHEEAAVQVKSEKGKGTEFILIIPKIERAYIGGRE